MKDLKIKPSRFNVAMAARFSSLLALDIAAKSLDANDVTATFAREFEHIDQELVREEYAPLMSEKLVPYDKGGGPTAQAETYRMVSQVGRAKWISSNASDLPRVDVTTKEFTRKTEQLGVSYSYTVMELLRSAENPTVRLDSERKKGAFEACQRLHEEACAIGNEDFGWYGFVNCPNVPLVTPLTGNWLDDSVTPDDILNDVLELFHNIAIATKGNYRADTLVIPLEYDKLFNRRLGDGSDVTIREWLIKSIQDLKNIESWHYLDTADEAGTGPRVVAYKKDKSVVRYHANEMFREQPPQHTKLEIEVPCWGVSAGTSVRKPLAMAYMDTGVEASS